MSGKPSEASQPSFFLSSHSGMSFRKLPPVSMLLLNRLDFKKSYSSKPSICMCKGNQMCLVGMFRDKVNICYHLKTKTFFMHFYKYSLNLICKVFKNPRRVSAYFQSGKTSTDFRFPFTCFFGNNIQADR